MRKSSVAVLVFASLFSGLLFFSCGQRTVSNDELISVVAISRHGIRSQTSLLSTTNLNTLRPEGFPLWPAPADVPGDLSTWGEENATRLGAWYREFYAAKGLMPAIGTCPADGTVFVYADTIERTRVTAQGYIDGMFSADSTSDNCGIQVHHYDGLLDPYILTIDTGKCSVVTATDQAAFYTAIGGSVAALKNTYSAQLQTLQTVTNCCQPEACNKSSPPASCLLADLPTTVSVNSKTGTVAFAGGTLFDVADSVTEDFELQYAQAMPETNCATTPGAQCVGWSAIPPGGLSDLTKLHVMNMDLTNRLPSVAAVNSTNLMWQLIGTMDQALTGVSNPDMLAPVTSTFTLFVAHDDNVASIAGFLGGVTWKAKGFQQNDPGPAGALVFELHKIKSSGQLVVKLFYVIASLDQMRNGTELSLQTPPQHLSLAIPACGGAHSCPYDQFKAFITNNVRKDCIVTAP